MWEEVEVLPQPINVCSIHVHQEAAN